MELPITFHDAVVVFSLAESCIMFTKIGLSNYQLDMLTNLLTEMDEHGRKLIEKGYPFVFKQLVSTGRVIIDGRPSVILR